MDISIIDKAIIFVRNKYHEYTITNYPYQILITDDWINEKQNKTDISHLNCINSGYDVGEYNFQRHKKITVYFTGDRTFSTIFYASSYNEIHDIIKLISMNSTSFPKLRIQNFSEFVTSIKFVKYDGSCIDVNKIINCAIQYKDNIKTFKDIAYLHKEIPQNIKHIKINYTHKMKKIEKIFNFDSLKDTDIICLNNPSSIQ